MAPNSNLMADLAQMANGAASAFGGMREEIDNLIRQRMERSLNARGLVTREEFDALCTRHEALAARLALLGIHESSSTPSRGLKQRQRRNQYQNARPVQKRMAKIVNN